MPESIPHIPATPTQLLYELNCLLPAFFRASKDGHSPLLYRVVFSIRKRMLILDYPKKCTE